MTLLSIFVLAIALAADAFAVGISVGLQHHQPRQIFRLSYHFGLFQALMPALGALAGTYLRLLVETAAPFIAASLLAIIGIKMLWEANQSNDKTDKLDPTRGWSLIGLSIAVSIDAFVAGIGLAMLHAPLILACIIIGVVASLATLFAMLNGKLLKNIFGIWAERIGGIVLILLAVKTFFDIA